METRNRARPSAPPLVDLLSLRGAFGTASLPSTPPHGRRPEDPAAVVAAAARRVHSMGTRCSPHSARCVSSVTFCVRAPATPSRYPAKNTHPTPPISSGQTAWYPLSTTALNSTQFSLASVLPNSTTAQLVPVPGAYLDVKSAPTLTPAGEHLALLWAAADTNTTAFSGSVEPVAVYGFFVNGLSGSAVGVPLVFPTAAGYSVEPVVAADGTAIYVLADVAGG
ncbi:hypothetical protein BDK51DRAFT_37040 [Blyttiomyces helicus]|uniref:Uncharacterized protein n=1 Tax=Blyttiomyces helicus TaxID=388810 RepID=A0A4P9W5L7_9FUNG|nr:hypothetical protein BDK51DRAFT_37040 [Blyttiomyces helicus]|eukprot:RKO87252.1 hypothetical protein BDK51DRAFT_37040 [Blyttiomyces helicus]